MVSHSATDELRERAELGDAGAQFELGGRYEKGDGVPKDCVMAHALYNAAVASGHEGAKEARDALGEKLSPEQLEEATRKAHEIFDEYRETADPLLPSRDTY